MGEISRKPPCRGRFRPQSNFLLANHCLFAILVCVQASSSVKQPDLVPAVTEETTEALTRDVYAFIHRLLSSGHRELFMAIEKAELSITQVKSLQVLAEAEEPMSLGAVSEALGLSLPAISRSVDALVQRGLVKREEDPRDRRSKLVTTTGRGRSTYERLSELRLAGLRTTIAELEPEEQQALADALAPVIRRLGL
jgi:DNA-binding MarR family transcriptional regulator